MSIGGKINALRLKKGFSQERLAEESGISLRTIQRIESGNTNPSGYTLNNLAVALNTSVDCLISNPDVDNEIFELINKLNLSAIIGLIFPFGNIILPYILWRKNKNKLKANEISRRILNFQLIWTIVASLNFLVFPIINYVLISNFNLRFFPITWIIFITLIIFNIYQSLKVSLLLKRKDFKIYTRVPLWF